MKRSLPKFKAGDGDRKEPDKSFNLKHYSIKGRIWIEKDNETFVGFGRIVLLERIKEFGSLSKAAKSMKMSYSHAWGLLDSMNRQSPEPLVKTEIGGKKGGSTELTLYGEKLIIQFYDLYSKYEQFLNSQKTLFDFLK